MRIYLILCSLLLLSIVPLSCSQNQAECEWRDLIEFEPKNSEVFAGYSGKTQAFSVKGTGIFIVCPHSLMENQFSTPKLTEGSFSIDVYTYPDMKLVKTAAIDDTWTGYEIRGDLDNARSAFIPVEKGMYCLYVSSSPYVVWKIAMRECI